jgi:hypothetical protein
VTPLSPPSLPGQVIYYAGWLDFRFPLSLQIVDEMLAPQDRIGVSLRRLHRALKIFIFFAAHLGFVLSESIVVIALLFVFYGLFERAPSVSHLGRITQSG